MEKDDSSSGSDSEEEVRNTKVTEEEKKKLEQTNAVLDLSVRITKDNYRNDDDRKINRFLELASPSSPESKGWKFQKQKDGVDIYLQYSEGSKIVMMRGDVKDVPVGVQEILNWISPAESILLVDPMCVSAKDLHSFDDNHSIQTACYKLVWPIAPRDFVWMQLKHLTSSGVGVVCSSSTVYDEYPPQKGIIRGEVVESGYVISPAGNNKCNLTYIVQADPKGWLPAWVVNLTATDQALNVIRTKEYWEERAAEKAANGTPTDSSQKKKKKKKKKKSKKKKNPNTEEN